MHGSKKKKKFHLIRLSVFNVFDVFCFNVHHSWLLLFTPLGPDHPGCATGNALTMCLWWSTAYHWLNRETNMSIGSTIKVVGKFRYGKEIDSLLTPMHRLKLTFFTIISLPRTIMKPVGPPFCRVRAGLYHSQVYKPF